MLGCKKEKVPFGRRPSKGSFGKRKNSFLKPAIKKKKVSSLEREFLEWLHIQIKPCFVCDGLNVIEWHHVKRDSTCQKDHTRLIPLCGESCHRLGTVLSAHGTPSKFRETYPISEQMEYAKKIYEEFLSSEL